MSSIITISLLIILFFSQAMLTELIRELESFFDHLTSKKYYRTTSKLMFMSCGSAYRLALNDMINALKDALKIKDPRLKGNHEIKPLFIYLKNYEIRLSYTTEDMPANDFFFNYKVFEVEQIMLRIQRLCDNLHIFIADLVKEEGRKVFTDWLLENQRKLLILFRLLYEKKTLPIYLNCFSITNFGLLIGILQ